MVGSLQASASAAEPAQRSQRGEGAQQQAEGMGMESLAAAAPAGLCCAVHAPAHLKKPTQIRHSSPHPHPAVQPEASTAPQLAACCLACFLNRSYLPMPAWHPLPSPSHARSSPLACLHALLLSAGLPKRMRSAADPSPSTQWDSKLLNTSGSPMDAAPAPVAGWRKTPS
jgi:hypothetical protein